MDILKGFLKFISIIICIFLCLIIFVLEIGIHTVYNTSRFINKENIKKIITNVDFEDYLKSSNEINSDFEEELKSIALESGIEYETITNIINSKEVKEIVGDYISSSVDAILNDGMVKKPTVDQIMGIIEDNEELIDKIAESEGVTIDSKNKKEILDSIRESIPEVIEQLPDISDEMDVENNEELITIRKINKIFTITTVLILIAMVVVIYLIISLLRWSFHKAMVWVAVPTILSSIVSIVLSLSINIIKTIVGGMSELFMIIGDTLLSNMFNKFLISGLIGLLVGIVLIAGFIAINVIKNKKEYNIIN